MRLHALAIALTFLGCPWALARIEVDFDREVRPILVANCYACHGPHDETREAGLRFDQPAVATARLKSGKRAIVPGSPQESEILLRLCSGDPKVHMPPIDHPALTNAQVETIRKWIEEGAKFSPPWAMSKLTQAAVPVCAEEDWCTSDIDRFLLSSRERLGLRAPTRDLDSASLIRKLSFDLRGLPPTQGEVEQFLADPSPVAFARIVDQFLAESAFGERWGRHWLDLARYAETLGHEFDYEMPDAWRYRDYVIDAFNRDLPVDRFISEQIAGDLLEPRAAIGLPNAAPVGTGWWFLGPAVHAPVDLRQDEADRIAGCVDVAGRSLLGMSLACARCHDHKFDPIPTRDFYALAGVVRNTRRVNAFVTTDLNAPGLLQRALEAYDRANALIPPPSASRAPSPVGSVNRIDDLADSGASWKKSGTAFVAAGRTIALDSAGNLLLGECGTIDSARWGATQVGSARSATLPVDHRYIHVRLRGSDATIRLIVDNYWLDERNPLLFEGLLRKLPHQEGAGEWRVETFDLARFNGERAYLELVDEGAGSIEVDWVASSDEQAPPDHSVWDVDEIPLIEQPLEQQQQIVAELAIAHEALDALSRCTPPVRALVAEEGGQFDEPVHIRGASHAPGDSVPRGELTLLASDGAARATGSGRLELAARLTDPATPFLWRTMANRVWMKLFGRGIVDTPDDFGQLGAPPWSPELLDVLALQLARDRSLKSLIRSIVHTHAYRAASDNDDLSTCWSPMAVRRLDAESIRDAMLCASGRLNPAQGGPSVPAHLTSYMQGRGRPEHSGPVDGDGRRSVYLAVRRNFLDPFMQAFDAPVPSTSCGRRHSTNVPAQTLALLNSEVVHALAGVWGEKVSASQATEDGRIETMWYAAYSRAPTSQERTAARDFLAAERSSTAESIDIAGRERLVYSALAHSLFATKEFIYLR